MNFHELIPIFGVYLSTFLVCLGSGFFPLINAEAWLVLVSIMAPKQEATAIILIAVLGQMLAKSALYMSGKGIFKVTPERYEKKMDQTFQKFQKWRDKTGWFIFWSAWSGFPPFYFVSILAGFLKLDFKKFIIAGFAGRLLRFSLVVFFPQLIKGFFK